MQKTVKQKAILALTIGANLMLGMTACQPKSDKDAKQAQTAESPVPQTQSAQVETKAATVSPSGLAAKKCLALGKAMQKVADHSQIEAIYAIQQQLETCLPTANNAEVLTLLKNYQAMYQRFLGTDDDSYLDYEPFYTIVEAIEQGEKIPAEPLKAMSPRVQYLTKLAQRKTDISILYIGEGLFIFNHDLQAMADLFTPYLPKDQHAFIQRMAKDNQDIFWNDAAVAVPLQEVIKRALFWEGYIQQYPDSYFIKDAKKLFALYRHVVFFGSDNTYWTDDLYREFYESKDEHSIKDLSLRPNSLLATDAKTLLSFMAMPDNERERKYPTDAEDTQNADNSEWAAWQKASDQLNEALPIASPWEDDDANGYRDCLSSIICIDYEY